MGMAKWATILVMVLAAILVSPAKAQSPQQNQAELYVTVFYDSDNDGSEEGVGFGTTVEIRESGSTQRFANFTGQNSTAGFLVNDGVTYLVDAYPKQTSLFYVWVCFGGKTIDEEQEFLILHCQEKFFIRFPWTVGE